MNSVNKDICHTPLKKYDSVLNDKSESYSNKVKSLIDVWKNISELNLHEFDIRYVIQIIDWAKLHALDIVLTGDWTKIPEPEKNSLLESIEKAQANLATVNDAFSGRCQKLADVVGRPWGDPVLGNLIMERNIEIGPKEIEFFCVETTYLVSVRLKKLCENQCEDLALNLVSNFLNYKQLATTQNYNLNATETQLWFIFDIYIALLYKFQDKSKIMQQFEDLQLEEGVGLIKRFAKKRVQISKIWRNCLKIAVFGCKFFLSRALMKYNDDIKGLLVDSLKTYLNLCNTDALSQEFVTSVRNITNLADAAGLCAMCEVIHKEAAEKLRHFAIEMYIRALTTDMNELERLKHVNEEDKVKFTTSRLSNTFTNLADLLDDHVKVARECILTAFSLEPSKDRLKRIEDLARRSGFPVLDTGQEWKCRLHPPALPSDDIAWVCPECGDWMCKPELTAPLQMNMALHEALQESVLGISEALCDDLVVCLSNPRYQILSWLLSWSDLYRLCIMYLNDPEKTKNFVTELKFVDVDYSKFQHIKREPVDEYTGIEKGYEQYLDLNFNPDEETSSVSEDSISHDKYLGMGSDGTGEPYLPLPQTRSDPNTLRSLRMFRPNLKRRKEDSESSTPGKRAAIDAAISNSSLSVGSYTTSQNPRPTSSSAFCASTSSSFSQPAHAIVYPTQYTAKLNYSSNNPVATSTSNLPTYTSRVPDLYDRFCNSGLQLVVNKNPNVRCYPSKSELHSNITASTMNQSNSVFKANLTSGTSTEYVSNIIKSNLTFGVPKISKNPPHVSYNSAAEVKKQGANYNQNSSRNTKKVLSHNAQELDLLLKEVANDIEIDTPKLDTNSKNGVAATLPKLGGQVANKKNQSIQVPQESLNPLMKSQLGTFSPNGTKEDCKMKLKNNQEVLSNLGKPLKQTTEDLSKKLNSTKTSQCGLISEMPILTVEIPKLDLASLPKQIVKQQSEIKQPTSATKTSTRDCQQTKTGLPQLKYHESLVQPSRILKGDTQLDPGLLDKIHSILNQERAAQLSTSTMKTTVIQPTHQPRALSLISHCQKAQLFTQKEQSPPETAVPQQEQDFQKPPTKVLHQNQELLVSITIPQLKSPKVTAQVSLSQCQSQNQTADLESEVISASMNLVKNQEHSRLLNSNNLEKTNGDKLFQTGVNQDSKATNQANLPATSTQVDSSKTVPLIMGCDKDKNLMVQNSERKKTDSEGTEVTTISSCNAKDNDSKSSQPETDFKLTTDDLLENVLIEYFSDENLNYQECIVETEKSTTNKSDLCVEVASEKKQLNSNKEASNLSLDKINVNNDLHCDTIIKVEKESDDSNDVVYPYITNWLKDVEMSTPMMQNEDFSNSDVTISNEKILKNVDILQSLPKEEKPDSVCLEFNNKYEDYDAESTQRYLCHKKRNAPKRLAVEKDKRYSNIYRMRKNCIWFNPIPFWHDYCKRKKSFVLKLRRSSTQSSFSKSSKILKAFKPTSECSKFFCFSSVQSEDSSDTNKENINAPVNSQIITNSSNEDDSTQNRFVTIETYPLSQQSLDNPSKKGPKDIKKYSNTHKRKHQNVPCFKLDQENSNHHNNRELTSLHSNSSVSSAIRNGGTDYLTKLKQLLSDTIEKKKHATIFIRRHGRGPPLVDNSNLQIRGHYNQNSINPRNILNKKVLKSTDIKKRVRFRLEKVAVLNNVPGLNDLSEVRPNTTEQVINVVQVSSTRPSTVTNQNIQTSTQVTPHIQRIGQPKISEQKTDTSPDESQSSSISTPTNIQSPKPSTSQSPTLINILNSQVKPGQRATTPSRPTPYINILSQQIMKQPIQQARKPGKPATTTPTQTATVIKVEPEGNIEAAKPLNSNVKVVATAQTNDAVATATSNQGSTILQFICKSSSLPKFQQAFGKTVYQASSSEDGSSETPTPPVTENAEQTSPTTNVETKKLATKTVPVNVQPIAGNVIFRGQVPVGQTVSLIPPGGNTRQLFRITGSTHEQISLVKETVIQNKMSALLAAALQGKPKITEQNGELVEEYSATRITLCRPGTVPNATRIVKPVQLQIPANVIKTPQSNMSLTTLEQLREFDMVYKQVKERSSNPAQPETTVATSQESPQQRISFTYVNQVQKYTQLSPVVVVSSYNPIQQTGSPALSVSSQSSSSGCLTQASTVAVPKVSVKSSKGKSIKSSTTKTTPSAVPTIPKPQQKPQEDEHTTQRIFDILAEYAEQLRNSPDLNNKPAPRRRSNPPTNPSSSSSSSSSNKKKKKKSNSSASNLVEADNEDLTMGSEDSSGGNIVQLSMTDEEQSQSASITPPDTNLEPASSNTSRPLIVTDTSNQPRNVIIADSSVGEALKMPNTTLIMPGSYIMPVSVVKGSQQIAVVSGGSKILTTVPARTGQNMLLFQSFVNQNKKPGGISTVKYSTIQPFSGISSQNVTGVSTQQPVVLPSNSVATVTLGQPITLKKVEDSERGNNTELLLTISQPSETIKIEKSPDLPQPDSSTNLSNDGSETKVDVNNQTPNVTRDNVFSNIQKTSSVATSVIASVVKKDDGRSSEIVSAMDSGNIKVEEPNKQVERIESVLVNASTSNGPMLSHTHPRYRKPCESAESTTQTVKEFNHNSGKVPVTGAKIFKNSAIYYAIRTKKPTSKKLDSDMQKQAAMERELRLQKSLSEECEDLGVDEPSTSDLFPEADLLFDSNHSPSYEQSGQKIQVAEVKAKASMNLFSDDENSGPMRNDLFDYVGYRAVDTDVDKITDNNVNESASSCDDTTLLPNSVTMSEVTLNSPISPEYTDNTHSINKYKYKYTNRKKGEKNIKIQPEAWSEVTSSEDTLELTREEDTPIAIQEETVIDNTLMEVETISEERNSSDREQLKCPHHNILDRGSRRASRKTCSCFNGLKSPKKRINSIKPQTPIPNKKPLIIKKR